VLHKLPGLAFQHGLQLSAQQLVAASKERIKGVVCWLEAAARSASAANNSSSSSVWHANHLDDPRFSVSLAHVILFPNFD
jgi:hypothetical protein